jgi:tetraacyldisaccharide 4'-kinase
LSLARDWWLPRLTVRTALLLPVSWIFAVAAGLRRMLYRCGLLRSVRIAVPVIVVGNLTVGGSGKTPLVIALVLALRAAGYRPGVISRGYGGAHDAARAAPLEVAPDFDSDPGSASPTPASGSAHAGDPAYTGDEPLLIRRRTGAPVFVGADRPRAALALLAAHPDVNLVISDDGLQHSALARDIEIAVFDSRGAGNGHLLPAGPLREPLARAAGLTALVHNGSQDIAAKIGSHQGFPAWHAMQIESLSAYHLVNPTQTCAPVELGSRGMHGKPGALAAVAGIGDPARFFNALRALGLTIGEHPFPDHHALTREDLATIGADTIVMTEKDALKCTAFNDARIWVLPIEARIDSALTNLILEKLRGRQAA